MRILVIDGHPDSGSFCDGLARAYVDGAGTRHEVRVIRFANSPSTQSCTVGTRTQRRSSLPFSKRAKQFAGVSILLRRAILGHCGFRPIRRTIIGPIKGATPAQRTAWLSEVHELGRRGA
ncbi:MAG TPA: hypothetical protein VGC44_13310 [Longimicrobiales bacterium]